MRICAPCIWFHNFRHLAHFDLAIRAIGAVAACHASVWDPRAIGDIDVTAICDDGKTCLNRHLSWGQTTRDPKPKGSNDWNPRVTAGNWVELSPKSQSPKVPKSQTSIYWLTIGYIYWLSIDGCIRIPQPRHTAAERRCRLTVPSCRALNSSRSSRKKMRSSYVVLSENLFVSSMFPPCLMASPEK